MCIMYLKACKQNIIFNFKYNSWKIGNLGTRIEYYQITIIFILSIYEINSYDFFMKKGQLHNKSEDNKPIYLSIYV